MALASQYDNFRATLNPTALAEGAQLHYVTTLVTVKEPGAITKHFSALSQQLKKKREDILSSLEDNNSLFEEIDTTIEFVQTGGAYLPNLDDNLVSGQTVTLPILHVVQFDSNGKIQQIRLYWDQASLLKAISVIGARGGSWPITDCERQVKLIRASTQGKSKDGLASTTKQMADVTITSRTTKKRDPSVDLFSGRDPEGESERPAPKGALKPHDRPLSELFVADDSNQSTPIANRSASPSKSDAIAPKIGAGKNFHDNRLFDANAEEPTDSSAKNIAPKIGAGKNFQENRLFDAQAEEVEEDVQGSPSEKSERAYMKPHPQKYDHFDFYDGHEDPVPQSSQPRPKTKHQSQWDFSDFVTPAKAVRTRGQSQGAHHFSFDDPSLENSPIKGIGHQIKPRRDAESHFELEDDGGDIDTPRGRSSQARGQTRGHNRNESSLWQSQRDEEPHEEETTATRSNIHNPVSQKNRNKDFGSHWQMLDDPNSSQGKGATKQADDEEREDHKPLASVTNIKDRKKDFGAHWAMEDENAGAVDDQHDAGSRSIGGLSLNKDKALKTMSAQWDARDTSPVRKSDSREGRIMHGAGGKENTGINIGGDGMGGRKGSARQWGFGDDDDDNANPRTTAVGSKGGSRGHGQRTEGYWNF